MTLVLIENGISLARASGMLAAYATGTPLGRLICGAAMDRLPMNIVSAIGMGLSAIGMLLIASPMDAPLVLTGAVLLMGLSMGAEADLMGYVISNKFGTRIYSSVFGLASAAMSASAAIGALLVSLTLALTHTFTLFLIIAAVCETLGAALLLTLRKTPLPMSEV